MARNAITGNRRTAERVAASLLEQLPDAEAICLYGSVARGDDESTSDIDFLVLGSAAACRDALGAIPADIPRELLSIRCCTRAELEQLLQDNPSFATHLAIEGIVLADRCGFLGALLSRPVRDITADDIRRAAGRLSQFDDLSRFNDDLLNCLSDLYLTGRVIVTLSLLKDRLAIFECRRAFATWRQLHPAHSDQVTVIEQLAPFMLLARRGQVQPLPFSPHGSAQQVARAVAALRSIAGA